MGSVWLQIREQRRRDYEFMQKCREKGIYPFDKNGKRIALEPNKQNMVSDKQNNFSIFPFWILNSFYK